MKKKLFDKYSQVFPVGSAGEQFPLVLAGRRRALLKNLDSICFFSGVLREPGAENIWIMNGLKIFQEPALMYLTGINQPEIILALNPLSPPHETLFLSEKNEGREFWDGIRFGWSDNKANNKKGLGEISRLTGIKNIMPLRDFREYFIKRVQTIPVSHFYCFYHSYPSEANRSKKKQITSDHNWDFYKKLKRWSEKIPGKKKAVQSVADLHFKLRLPLDKYQVKDVYRAVKFTNHAFVKTLKKLPDFKTEHEIATFLEYKMKNFTTSGLSFPSIVASGKNATILHYLKNDGKVEKNSLLLLDFGVRVGTMHADISRTVPVNGKFNPLQKILYEIVLSALKLNQANAVMGSTIRNLNREVWNHIEKQLELKFFSKGGTAKRNYTAQPHGVSHLMGEQEHDGDPFKIYQDIPLQKNWQISNEPGIYGHFSIKIRGKRYSQYIGIRIEDNLLITPSGALCLSRKVPREISELESLIGSE